MNNGRMQAVWLAAISLVSKQCVAYTKSQLMHGILFGKDAGHRGLGLYNGGTFRPANLYAALQSQTGPIAEN